MIDPLWINASGGLPEYDANELRQGMALAMMYDGRAVGARQGVRPGGTQFEVSIDGSGNITVAPGVALVDPGLSTPQGPYWVALGAADTSLDVDPADPTNPRKDIVVLRVYDDDEDSSGLRTARPEYLAGTPAPSPTEPAVPAGAMRLATIDVPQSGGGSPVVTDRRPYTVAAGGLLPVPNQAARDAVTDYPGLAVYRLDQGWTEIHDGSGWRVQGVPTVSAVGDLSTLITDPYHGQLAYVTGEDRIYRYTGSAWVSSLSIPGERIATDITTSDSAAINTTETAVMSVTASLVSGRTYRITGDFAYLQTVANDSFLARIREDNATGTQLQLRRLPELDATTLTFSPARIEVEYTATSTASKTFVVTLVRSIGTGDINLEAASNAPAYLYVEYIRG